MAQNANIPAAEAAAPAAAAPVAAAPEAAAPDAAGNTTDATVTSEIDSTVSIQTIYLPTEGCSSGPRCHAVGFSLPHAALWCAADTHQSALWTIARISHAVPRMSSCMRRHWHYFFTYMHRQPPAIATGADAGARRWSAALTLPRGEWALAPAHLIICTMNILCLCRRPSPMACWS